MLQIQFVVLVILPVQYVLENSILNVILLKLVIISMVLQVLNAIKTVKFVQEVNQLIVKNVLVNLFCMVLHVRTLVQVLILRI